MSAPRTTAQGTDPVLLEVRGLRTHFFTEEGVGLAVDGIDLTLAEGQTLGLVGESGCGKSVTALSILGLVPAPGRIVEGRVLLRGEDLLKVGPERLRQLRGDQVAMVFQEPTTALNPVLSIGNQLIEAIQVHRPIDAAAARARAIELLGRVGFSAPEQRMDAFPHELSGGLQQRVMIAMAISCGPQLLIADEPTTALDVTTQAQILDLISDLQREDGMGLLLITHDLAVIAEAAQFVAVMYAGKIVEYGNAEDFFRRPLHPYSIGLLRALPGRRGKVPGRERLQTIPGMVPPGTHFPSGCRFRTRCSLATERCAREEPLLGPPAGSGAPEASGATRDNGEPGSHVAACHFLVEAARL